MTIAEREQQILRIKSESFQSEMTSELENTLRMEVAGVIKTTIEAARFRRVRILSLSAEVDLRQDVMVISIVCWTISMEESLS